MFLIVSFWAHGTKHDPDSIPLNGHKHYVQHIEIYDQSLGEVVEMRLFSSKVQDQTKNKESDRVCLEYLSEFISASEYTLRRVQSKKGVQKQIRRNNDKKRAKIKTDLKCPFSEQVRPSASDYDKPRKQIRECGHEGVKHNVKTVEALLIIFDHIIFTLFSKEHAGQNSFRDQRMHSRASQFPPAGIFNYTMPRQTAFLKSLPRT